MKLTAHNMEFKGKAHNGILIYHCPECNRRIGIDVAPFTVYVFIPGDSSFVHMSDTGPIAGSLDPAKPPTPTDEDNAWLKVLGIQEW